MSSRSGHEMNINLAEEAKVPSYAIRVGDRAEFQWWVELSEIDDFARISGDRNPLHMSDDFARSKGFSGRVAHGFLFGAKVSALVGMLLPGRDCLILEQSISFVKPIFPGETITIEGSVAEMSQEQHVLKVRVRAMRTDGDHRIVIARGSVLCRNQ